MRTCHVLIKVATFTLFVNFVFCLEGALKMNFIVHQVLPSDLVPGGESDNDNEFTLYITTLEIGSNDDKNEVIIDTSSSELWVISSDVHCKYPHDYHGEQDPSRCLEHGSFSYEESDTFEMDLANSYYYSMSNRGFEGTDNIKVNNVKINDFIFAVTNETSNSYGNLGLGQVADLESNYSYSILPYTLTKQGTINKPVYSIYVNKQNTNGTVLFGAIDSSKYSGSLMTLPINRPYYSPSGIQTLVSGMYFSDGKNAEIICDFTQMYFINALYSLSSLPGATVRSIANKLNATYTSTNAHRVKCEVDSAYELILDFNGKQIRVPISSLIREGDDGYCYLGLIESDVVVLGDNILKHIYMVINLEDDEISIAQASYSEEEKIEIVSDLVPNATRVPNYSFTEEFAAIILTPSISMNSDAKKSTVTIPKDNILPTAYFSNICEQYTVANETCEEIALKLNISVADLENYNNGICDDLFPGLSICISRMTSQSFEDNNFTSTSQDSKFTSTTHDSKFTLTSQDSKNTSTSQSSIAILDSTTNTKYSSIITDSESTNLNGLATTNQPLVFISIVLAIIIGVTGV